MGICNRTIGGPYRVSLRLRSAVVNRVAPRPKQSDHVLYGPYRLRVLGWNLLDV